MKKILFSALFSCLFIAASAQFSNHPFTWPHGNINTAVPFLRINPDARAGGMGEGSVAMSNDANAMYWNVSRLAFAKQKYGFAVTFSPWMPRWLAGAYHGYVAAYYKPDDKSTVGVSTRYLRHVVDPWFASEKGDAEKAVDIGYTRRLSERFAVGGTFRVFQSDAIRNHYNNLQSGTSWCGDIGVSWIGKQHANENWTTRLQAGAAITNIGPKVPAIDWFNYSEDFLPTNLGVAFGLEATHKVKHHFAVQVEANKLLVPSTPHYLRDEYGTPVIYNGQYAITAGKDPNRSALGGMLYSFSDSPNGVTGELQETTVSTGFEYNYNHFLKARTGFFYEDRAVGYRQFITFGAGITYKLLSLDLNYVWPLQHFSDFEHMYRVTLLVKLDSFRRTKTT